MPRTPWTDAEPGVRTAVVVGNPRPASRTLAAATHLARELSGHEPQLVVDLATLGTALLEHDAPQVDDLAVSAK